MFHTFKKLPILILFFPLPSFSQNTYTFQHLTVEDGLISNPGVNTFQDSGGYYWFSTVNGIQRYDGKNFISYSYPHSGTKNSASERVANPVEDKQGNIWLINDEGINIYQRKHRGIARLYLTDAADSNTNNARKIIKDRQDNIWIISNKNIYQYSYREDKAVLVRPVLTDPRSGIVTAVTDQKKQKFWLLISQDNTYRVICYDNLENSLQDVTDPALAKLLGQYGSSISFFKFDESGNIWMSDYFGTLSKFNTSTRVTRQYPILHDINKRNNRLNYCEVYDFLDDGGKTIWFGGENMGLLKYDKSGDTFSSIAIENNSNYGLHYDERIFSIYKDREGNIWVDTDMGMNIFNPDLQQFKYLNQNRKLPFSQSTSNVTSIFESSKNDIWVSTWGNGIFRYDSNFNLKNNYVYNRNNPASFGEPLNRAWAFGEDAKGKIWIGSQYGMLSVFDKASDQFFNRVIPEFRHFTIMHIAKDKRNNIWFGLFNGMLGKWNADSDRISVYDNLYGTGMKEPTVIDGICVDPMDKVWVATSIYGLTRFNEARREMDEKALFPQHIFSPVPLNDSVIIGGTLDRGLFLYNSIDKSTKYINTSDGLSSDKVFGTLADRSGNIWILASNGIERLNLKSWKIYHYNLNDGIKDHVFSRAFCKLKNGVFMVAANSGILCFNPESVRVKSPPPDVVVTSFSADQRSFSVDSLLQGKEIQLPHSQNAVAFEFASVSFIGRNTDQYFYRLSGIDHNWITAGVRRSVTYANLAPGKYSFTIKSRNADGIESSHITSLDFAILPPWRQTWWARSLWICLMAIVVYVVYDYRKRNRQALSNMRLKIASDLHDDIGSTLNSISVYSEIAGRQMDTDPGNASTLLLKMGVASRNMIDTMNDIVWAVNPKNDYFANILQRMQYFAGELLSGKDILFQFNVAENVKNIKLPMGKRKNAYLIFKESISNTYKYSNCRNVSVTVGLQANNMLITIRDDGDGFELADKTGNGNGLLNMQVRAKEINGRLEISSFPEKGTLIELWVPV